MPTREIDRNQKVRDLNNQADFGPPDEEGLEEGFSIQSASFLTEEGKILIIESGKPKRKRNPAQGKKKVYKSNKKHADDNYDEMLERRRASFKNWGKTPFQLAKDAFTKVTKVNEEQEPQDDMFLIVFYRERGTPLERMRMNIRRYSNSQTFLKFLADMFQSADLVSYAINDDGNFVPLEPGMDDDAWEIFSPLEIRVRRQ